MLVGGRVDLPASENFGRIFDCVSSLGNQKAVRLYHVVRCKDHPLSIGADPKPEGIPCTRAVRTGCATFKLQMVTIPLRLS